MPPVIVIRLKATDLVALNISCQPCYRLSKKQGSNWIVQIIGFLLPEHRLLRVGIQSSL
jgi:hypothetical protein